MNKSSGNKLFLAALLFLLGFYVVLFFNNTTNKANKMNDDEVGVLLKDDLTPMKLMRGIDMIDAVGWPSVYYICYRVGNHHYKSFRVRALVTDCVIALLPLLVLCYMYLVFRRESPPTTRPAMPKGNDTPPPSILPRGPSGPEGMDRGRT
ncbi:MAG: hypothetical protein V1809_11135 [Planctomycetota bacterium]